MSLLHWSVVDPQMASFSRLSLGVALLAFLRQAPPPLILRAQPHAGLLSPHSSHSGAHLGLAQAVVVMQDVPAGFHHLLCFWKSHPSLNTWHRVTSFMKSPWLYTSPSPSPRLRSVSQCLLNVQRPRSVVRLELSGQSL